jgi:hypothetical protein
MSVHSSLQPVLAHKLDGNGFNSFIGQQIRTAQSEKVCGCAVHVVSGKLAKDTQVALSLPHIL